MQNACAERSNIGSYGRYMNRKKMGFTVEEALTPATKKATAKISAKTPHEKENPSAKSDRTDHDEEKRYSIKDMLDAWGIDRNSYMW